MRRVGRGTRAVGVALAATFLAAGGALGQDAEPYARSSAGTRSLSFGSGTSIKVLLEASNLGGGEIEIAEISFPVGMNPPNSHVHGSTEIFYVVEGVLGHVVNGEEHRLEPGMVGVVKPGDTVIHRVLSDVPVKTLVLWLPGGEADRIAPRERWTPIGN